MHALNFAHNYYGPSVVVPGYSELYPELQVNDIKGLTDLYGPAPGYTPPTEGMYTLASGGAWPYDPIWGTTRIPYRFDESLNDIFPSGWQNQFRLVLDEFESVANLTFIEVGPEHQFKVMDVSAADIDGPGRTIAWAYYPAPHEIAWHSSPLYGNIIFDRTENWGILYPVPEPSTAALAVIGGLILICAWRRRRKT